MYVCAFKSLSIPHNDLGKSWYLAQTSSPKHGPLRHFKQNEIRRVCVFGGLVLTFWHLVELASSCATSTCICSDTGRENG